MEQLSFDHEYLSNKECFQKNTSGKKINIYLTNGLKRQALNFT